MHLTITGFEFILKNPLCLKFALDYKIENVLFVLLKNITLTRKLHRLLLASNISLGKRNDLFLTYIYISVSLQSWLSYVTDDFSPHLTFSPEML